jgi:DNA-binding beta-propeller fold protein YncE
MTLPTAKNSTTTIRRCIPALIFLAFLLTGCGEDWKWGSWHADNSNAPVTGTPVADSNLVISPWGLAGFGTDLYVTENSRHRLIKISTLESDETNNLIWSLEVQGSGEGEFLSPEGVTVDGAGNVYVADRGNGRVQKFDSDGNFLAELGDTDPEFGLGDLIDPVDIAIDGDGFIYVTDAEVNAERIVKFNTVGDYYSHWGINGTGDGELNQPSGLAIDTVAHELYVVDAGNHRVQVFDLNGVYLRQFGEEGIADGQFTTPWGVTIDSADGVYISDRTANNIQLFDTAGTFLKALNVSEDDDALDTPTGITTLGGSLWVCETDLNRVRGF